MNMTMSVNKLLMMLHGSAFENLVTMLSHHGYHGARLVIMINY